MRDAGQDPDEAAGDGCGTAARREASARRSIALVGMMGAGKTSIGRRLAPRLGLPFRDADAEIEKAAGMSVSDLFAAHGEESFRDGEARVIERLLDGPPIVLAAGGGAVISPRTRANLKRRATTIWVKADIDTLTSRATRRDTRPLLRDGDPRATMEALLKARERFFAEADIEIDSGQGPIERTVDRILAALTDRGVDR